MFNKLTKTKIKKKNVHVNYRICKTVKINRCERKRIMIRTARKSSWQCYNHLRLGWQQNCTETSAKTLIKQATIFTLQLLNEQSYYIQCIYLNTLLKKRILLFNLEIKYTIRNFFKSFRGELFFQ